MFKGKNIILGVTSSIAAYKSANVASALVKKGCNVNVLMTENATNFINPLTFEELTKHKCIIDTFDRNVQYNVAHISLAVSADAFIIAPASANVIGKIANGIADDMKPHIFEMFYTGKNTGYNGKKRCGPVCFEPRPVFWEEPAYVKGKNRPAGRHRGHRRL